MTQIEINYLQTIFFTYKPAKIFFPEKIYAENSDGTHLTINHNKPWDKLIKILYKLYLPNWPNRQMKNVEKLGRCKCVALLG